MTISGRSIGLGAGASTAAAVALIAAGGAGAGSTLGSAAACKPTFVNGVHHLCGPATARLSVFPGVVFRHGSCKRSTVGGEPEMSIEIGEIKPGASRNGGLPYFRASIDGPLSRPTGGHVIAYYHSRRWSGLGRSCRCTARSGTFTVRAVPPSRGTASGSYHC
jgi:hypothetical protein